MGDCLPCHHSDEQRQFSGLHLKQMNPPTLKRGRGNAWGHGEDKKGDVEEKTQGTRVVERLYIYSSSAPPSARLASFWGFGDAGLDLGSQLIWVQQSVDSQEYACPFPKINFIGV